MRQVFTSGRKMSVNIIKAMQTIAFALISFTYSYAQLDAYEGFDYNDNTSIYTQAGGYGWATTLSGWRGPGGDNRVSTASPLVYTGLSVTGNYMSHTAYSERINRQFLIPGGLQNANGFLGKSGTTVYLSYLFKKKVNTAGWYGLGPVVQLIKFTEWLGNYDNEPNKLGVGALGNSNVFQVIGGANNVATNTSASLTLGSTYFVVVKYIFGASSTTVAGFINPDPTAAEPTPTFTQVLNTTYEFDAVYFALGDANDQVNIDEIHVGESWNIVTPDAASLVALTSVQITNAAPINTLGGDLNLTYSTLPNNASVPVSAKWKVSDSRIAAINSSGRLTAIANGVVTVTLEATNPQGTVVTTTSTITITGQGAPASTLLAYEGFNLASGSVYTAAGSGFGWNGNWTGGTSANYSIGSGSPLIVSNLSYTGNYALTGQAYNYQDRLFNTTTFAGYIDNITNTFSRQGRVLWMSALIRPEASGKYFAINLGNSGPGGDIQFNANTRIEFGYLGGNSIVNSTPVYTLQSRSSANNPPLSGEDGLVVQNSTVPVVVGQPVLVVYKVTFGGNSSNSFLDIFINPALGTTPTNPDITAVYTATPVFRKVSIGSDPADDAGPSASFDEIRFGTTFASVTPMFPPAAITAVGINASDLTVKVTKSVPVSSVLQPSNAGGPLTYNWFVSNNALASISGTGSSVNVVGLNGGVVTITSQVSNPVSTVAGTYVLTVIPLIPLTSATVTPSTSNITVGGIPVTIDATYTPGNAENPVNYIWSVSNSALATFSGTGNSILLYPVSAGSLTVTATIFNDISTVTGSTVMVVSPAPPPVAITSVTINTSNNVLTVGGTNALLAASYLPANAASPVTYQWSVSDASVASFTGINGAIAGLVPVNTGIVIVTTQAINSVSTISGTTVITVVGISGNPVINPLTSISITGGADLLTVGETTQYGVITAPGNAGEPISVTFETSDAAIATIANDGTLTAIAAGTVTITAIAVNPVSTVTGTKVVIITVIGGNVAVNEGTGLESVSIYPVPASEYLTVETQSPVTVEISNAIGIRVTQPIVVTSKTTIDVSTYNKGLYFLKVTKGTGVVVKKVIVK